MSTVDVSSTGTKIQIRVVGDVDTGKAGRHHCADPTDVDHPGHNSIPVNEPAPTSNLLVWISTLGSTDGKSRAAISEITVQAAS